MPQCSHSPHQQYLERRLAHSHWIPASHSNRPPTVLSGIQSATLSLAHCVSLDPDHILYGLLSGSSDTRQVRLRPRRSFVPTAQNLLDNLARLSIRASEWTNHKWKTEYYENASKLRVFVSKTGARPVGMGLPRAAWVKLNHLRTGVGRFHSSMHKWGLASSPNCECGASEQTADHVLIACTIHWAPHEHEVWRFWMTKFDAGLITPLPTSDSGNTAAWVVKNKPSAPVLFVSDLEWIPFKRQRRRAYAQNYCHCLHNI